VATAAGRGAAVSGAIATRAAAVRGVITCRAALFLLASHFEFNSQLAELFIVALEEIANERHKRSRQDHHQAHEDLKLILPEFHCSSIIGAHGKTRNSR
jgi:hypothetical protein